MKHGLKTSYDDFIGWVKSMQCDYSNLVIDGDDGFEHRISRNGFIRYFLAYANSVPGWVDLEKIIKNISSGFQFFSKLSKNY